MRSALPNLYEAKENQTGYDILRFQDRDVPHR
jgi:hypothetical protein